MGALHAAMKSEPQLEGRRYAGWIELRRRRIRCHIEETYSILVVKVKYLPGCFDSLDLLGVMHLQHVPALNGHCDGTCLTGGATHYAWAASEGQALKDVLGSQSALCYEVQGMRMMVSIEY